MVVLMFFFIGVVIEEKGVIVNRIVMIMIVMVDLDG